uniref:Histone acetyltransferase n=1 Tax=Trichobilharzia regenti TaxID=157069 RepID=A0AA85JU08_TRIRE|nr:unnamed protein product [Trichobilharzia regenti]
MKKPLAPTSSRRLKSQRSIVSWTMKRPKKVDISNYPPVCPLVGCSGLGHINGKDVIHITLSGCPFYHNMSFAKWIEMCSREEGLVIAESVKQVAASSESPSKAKNKLDRSYQFKTTQREPLLDDLATPIELYQFRRAQQLVVSTCEMEVREHLLLCARIASYSSTSAYTEDTRSATEQRIRSVILGNWDIEPWYQSNYPADLCCLPCIYICEFCLTGMSYYVTYHRHKTKCGRTCPPGNEVYRKDNLSFFEIDGEHYQEYCQNLCLLAKLFLKQKTVWEEDQVPEFLFYVLTETDEEGSHIIGYFSKQKPDVEIDYSASKSVHYNLSCILILPPYQCRGFGRMLIEMSKYEFVEFNKCLIIVLSVDTFLFLKICNHISRCINEHGFPLQVCLMANPELLIIVKCKLLVYI